MPRKIDRKSETLYVYVTPDNKKHVKKMRGVFKSESDYVDFLIEKDRKKQLKKADKCKGSSAC